MFLADSMFFTRAISNLFDSGLVDKILWNLILVRIHFFLEKRDEPDPDATFQKEELTF
jgi:hypothetical protein